MREDERVNIDLDEVPVAGHLRLDKVPVSPVIGGGIMTKQTEFPHMAALGSRERLEDNTTKFRWECGGSLISDRFVLTAAHCLRNSSIEVVHLGDLDLESDADDSSLQIFAIKRKIIHPEYTYPKKYHDIALIELDKPIRKNQHVSPACLYTKNEPPKVLIATGWGKTAFIGNYSGTLLKVALNHVEQNKCSTYYQSARYKKRYLPQGIRKDGQICAGDVVGKDTCFGDSGGPLQVPRPTEDYFVYDIVGVTSFGQPCTLSESPGVFTRVFHYLPWIEENVWPDEK